MSDEALKDAKIAELQKTNQSLTTAIRSCSGQISAMKQCIDEYINANIQLRSSNLLLEDDLNRLRPEMQMFKDRVEILEKEKKDLVENMSPVDPA